MGDPQRVRIWSGRLRRRKPNSYSFYFSFEHFTQASYPIQLENLSFSKLYWLLAIQEIIKHIMELLLLQISASLERDGGSARRFCDSISQKLTLTC